MLSLYVLYVAATFYTSRADEPLHADLALHEFPPEDGGIGEPAPQPHSLTQEAASTKNSVR
jgi:hypothetical protein